MAAARGARRTRKKKSGSGGTHLLATAEVEDVGVAGGVLLVAAHAEARAQLELLVAVHLADAQRARVVPLAQLQLEGLLLERGLEVRACARWGRRPFTTRTLLIKTSARGKWRK